MVLKMQNRIIKFFMFFLLLPVFLGIVADTNSAAWARNITSNPCIMSYTDSYSSVMKVIRSNALVIQIK
jgi:hypothetical protein